MSNPREESYREVDADRGVPDRPVMDIGLARDDRTEDAEFDCSSCRDFAENSCRRKRSGEPTKTCLKKSFTENKRHQGEYPTIPLGLCSLFLVLYWFHEL